MHKNKSVDVHQFSMVPRAEIPRSQFMREFTHKSTFDAGYLIPIYVDEVLPGDTFNLRATMFARMSTPLYPIMDNLHLDSFFFFSPARLLWDNFQRFMGERDNPDDSISFTIPTHQSPTGGYAVGSLQDYMGLPTVGQVGAQNHFHHNALPIRMYNLTYNQWFRDQNLQDSVVVDKGDSGDDVADYVLLRRGKRHDYFTSCLPWAQKGNTVSVGLGTSAPLVTTGNGVPEFQRLNTTTTGEWLVMPSNDPNVTTSDGAGSNAPLQWHDPKLEVDLSSATAITINALRQSFQIQKLLERDARGGSRYTELVRSHFGVVSPDHRLQRVEYLGGGTTPINVTPIAQTSATGLTGGTTPTGNLAGIATALAHNHGFTASFTEHGYILGMVAVRADLTYQQGLRKMWSRSTRYDFYFPAFAMLGEQAVLKKEIYCDGSATDDEVFGYQERWSEYRHLPSMITGLFRSTSAGTLDGWHLAQEFGSHPDLDDTFIQDTPPLDRVLAVGAAANGKQFIFDAFFQNKVARPMPMFSVPGLIDHF